MLITNMGINLEKTTMATIRSQKNTILKRFFEGFSIGYMANKTWLRLQST